MWLGELHFDPARSVLSSPLCVASAIAMRTQRMKIGLAVQVLPLCHPLRLAEEAATVDQLSGGRLIFGVGRSGVARTYEAYGVRTPKAASGSRKFSISCGRRGRRRRCRIRASIIGSRMWRWCRSRSSSRRRRSVSPLRVPIRLYGWDARGCRYRGSPLRDRGGNRAAGFAAYREAVAASGHAGSGGVFLRVPAYIALTDAQARAEAEPSLIHFYRQQAALLAVRPSARAWMALIGVRRRRSGWPQ